MFPALVVAGFTVEFAVKKTLLLEVHAVLKGPLLEDPQVESVQFPETPSVRQYSCACAPDTEAAKIARTPNFRTRLQAGRAEVLAEALSVNRERKWRNILAPKLGKVMNPSLWNRRLKKPAEARRHLLRGEVW